MVRNDVSDVKYILHWIYPYSVLVAVQDYDINPGTVN